jgi:hypothetical protein
MSTIRLILVTLSLVLFCAGCVRAPGGVAASNIPLAPGSYTPIGTVFASDCKVNLLGFIPVSGGNNLYQALDKAKRKRGAGALIEITVDYVSKYFILWSQACTEVRATAVSLSAP